MVITYLDSAPGFDEPFSAEIGFLVPELVAGCLAPGVRFTLNEGPRPVAEGVLTDLLADSAAA